MMFALFEDASFCFMWAAGFFISFSHPRLWTFAAFGDGTNKEVELVGRWSPCPVLQQSNKQPHPRPLPVGEGSEYPCKS